MRELIMSCMNTIFEKHFPLHVQDFNDQKMATAYLLTLKRAGREYAWDAMETSTPVVRTFLEDAFRMASYHAFDVWQWMVKKGYYPVEAASPQSLNTIGQIYQVVGEPAMASR